MLVLRAKRLPVMFHRHSKPRRFDAAAVGEGMAVSCPSRRHSIVNTIALLGILLAGFYLVGLAVLSFMNRAAARRFLLGFAGSACVHYLELATRLAVGGAFVIRAPLMKFPTVFSLFGWVLIITTACLLALPWQTHQRFAQQAVPHALRWLRLVGLASFSLGGLILFSALL